jgi:Family of unknown function (DUF5989)
MNDAPDDFEKAARARPTGLVREILGLLRQNKKWWLLPILISLLAFGVLIAIAVVSPGAAPFIYTLF